MEYARVIGEWETSGRNPIRSVQSKALTVNELLVGYWRFAEGYYRKNGQPTKQLDRIKRSLSPVKALYDQTFANECVANQRHGSVYYQGRLN